MSNTLTPPRLTPPRTGSPSRTMRRVSLRNLGAHKVRLALTIISVVLGTAFVAGSFVFTDTLKKSFNSIFADAYQGVAVHIQPSDDHSAGVALSLVETLRSTEGVAKVQPAVTGSVVLVGADGKPVQSGGAPSMGTAWVEPTEYIGEPITIVKGAAPSAPGQILLNESAAEKAKLQVGQRTTVITAAGSTPVTLVGIYHLGTASGGYIGMIFDASQATQLFTDGKHVSSIDVAATAGVSQQTLRDRVAANLPAGVEAITGQQAKDKLQSLIETALSFINYVLLAFGLIALVVGTFIIYNTFSMLVAQRLRELALLRAIGADRRQITRAVLLEAVLVGAIGSAIGIAAGVALAFALRSILTSLGLGLPAGELVLKPATVLIGLILGIGVTVISAYAPARRAAKTAPVEAMRAEFASTGTSLRRRTLIGAVLFALGVAAAAAGASASSVGAGSALLGLALLLVTVAVLLIAPALSALVIGLIGHVIGRPFGTIGRLARSNAVRNPRRTAATAFALTLGLMLVSAISVIGSSAKTSLNSVIDNGVQADFIISSANNIPVPQAAVSAVSKLPGVGAFVSLYSYNADVSGAGDSSIRVSAVDGPIAQVVALHLESGTEQLDAEHVLVSQERAADSGWTVGQQITLTQSTGEQAPVSVSGIYRNNDFLGGMLSSTQTMDALTTSTNRTNFLNFVKAAPGTELSTLKQQILNVTDPFFVVTVQTKDEFKGSTASSIDGLLNVIYALLGLAVVIAVLGIINTLALSVVERRREIGMLRAVGMVRGQLRRTIYLESALIAVFGALLGLAIGVSFGALFTHLLRNDGLGTLAIPWGQVVAFLVVAAIVGVLAALWPAFRAARIRALEAITE